MSNQIILPSIMQIGAKASQEIGPILISLDYKKPLIITDKMMVELGYASKIQESLNSINIHADIFADTIPEPTVASIQAGVNKIKSADYAIPTTAGTGSEVTRFTIIADETTDEKMLCVGRGFMPSVALIDYELTLSLPQRATADTGIDALTHAMEAYVGKKANPYSDAQAIAAMRLIGPNLRRVYHNGKDIEAREKMMLGATLAGIAFSNASVALVHGMSRPIGAFYHVYQKRMMRLQIKNYYQNLLPLMKSLMCLLLESLA